MLPLYSLSIAHANDRLVRSEFIEASATLLLVNALASIVGPSLAAFIIAHSAMASLFFYTAAVHLLMAVFTIARITMVRAPSGEMHEHLVALPQMASPNAFELDPRGPEHVVAHPAADTPRAA